ncbi:hypothetical protein E2C01_090782 [Portunus trituberculatus]|uniref:Uncharacterized protein n=1 Tax=Portunus trituberculatus TaxID=210409 RepID=A0A5B7JTB0_PORTR|nr:hypothetical protein [Portunus trituberculatus]
MAQDRGRDVDPRRSKGFHFKEPRGYAPGSLKGQALWLEIQQLKAKGAIEEEPPTPGFYSYMFVVPKAS